MSGIYDSLFDNPHNYRWEPDIQKEKRVKVVELRSEEWPDGEVGYDYIENEKVKEDFGKEEKKRRAAIQQLYVDQCKKLTRERNKLKKKLKEKEEELKNITSKQVFALKKEIAEYTNKTVKVEGKIYEVKNYTVTVGHLKALLEDIEDNEGIVQIVEGRNDDFWRNCRYTMLRILLNETTARRMVPSDPEAVVE